MQFRADQYFQAAAERMSQARKLYQDGTAYALSMYCAGLAVECILRAFRWQEDPSFEGRHNLDELLKASRILAINDDFMRQKGETDDSIKAVRVPFNAAVAEVVTLWHTNLRFASETSLKAFLKSKGRLHGTKGDPLKKNALDLLNSAQAVVDRGVTLWTSKKKS
jgi:HEPN domain-containing protein